MAVPQRGNPPTGSPTIIAALEGVSSVICYPLKDKIRISGRGPRTSSCLEMPSGPLVCDHKDGFRVTCLPQIGWRTGDAGPQTSGPAISAMHMLFKAQADATAIPVSFALAAFSMSSISDRRSWALSFFSSFAHWRNVPYRAIS